MADAIQPIKPVKPVLGPSTPAATTPGAAQTPGQPNADKNNQPELAQPKPGEKLFAIATDKDPTGLTKVYARDEAHAQQLFKQAGGVGNVTQTQLAQEDINRMVEMLESNGIEEGVDYYVGDTICTDDAKLAEDIADIINQEWWSQGRAKPEQHDNEYLIKLTSEEAEASNTAVSKIKKSLNICKEILRSGSATDSQKEQLKDILNRIQSQLSTIQDSTGTTMEKETPNIKESDISGLLAASKLNREFIVTAKTYEGDTKRFRVKAQSERTAREKFQRHHSQAEILSVKEPWTSPNSPDKYVPDYEPKKGWTSPNEGVEEGVAEGSEKAYGWKIGKMYRGEKEPFEVAYVDASDEKTALAKAHHTLKPNHMQILTVMRRPQGVAEATDAPTKVGFNDIVVTKQSDGNYKIVRKGGAWMRLKKGEILTSQDVKELKANRAVFHVEQGVAEGNEREEMVGFHLDSERAYEAVMARFGDVIDHDEASGTMYVPERIWPKVEMVAYDADGIGAQRDDELENPEHYGIDESTEDSTVGIEAYGVKGMKSTPWRKTFPTQAAFERWMEKADGDYELLGVREVEVPTKKKYAPMREGYRVVPSIDRERYTDLSDQGLEGPFRLESGRVVYYDPKAGKYYDRDTDMYIDDEEYHQHQKVSEDDEYSDEGEESQDQFYIALYDEDENTTFVGLLYRDGKWREEAVAGTAPYNWGSQYMSYLSPHEVMQWIEKDYGRGYEIAGPFDTKQEAMEYAEYNFGPMESVTEAKHGLNKRVRIVSGPADAVGKIGTVGEARHGLHKDAPKTYTVDYEDGTGRTTSVQLQAKDLRLVKESKESKMNTKKVAEAKNHMDETEYTTYAGWKRACRAAGADSFEGDKDICQAMKGKKSVGEWDGATGSVYGDAHKAKKVAEATKEIKGGRVHTAEPGGYGRQADDEELTPADRSRLAAKKRAEKAAQPKRGRGRPKADVKVDSSTAAKELQRWIVGSVPKSKALEKLPKTAHKIASPADKEIDEEGNEFTGALAAAKASGAKEFTVGGKKHKVKESMAHVQSLKKQISETIRAVQKLPIAQQNDPRVTALVSKLEESVSAAVGGMLRESRETLEHIVQRFPAEVKGFVGGDEMNDDLYHALYDYYLLNGEMPYGVAKARSGDPMEWVAERFDADLDLMHNENLEEGSNPNSAVQEKVKAKLLNHYGDGTAEFFQEYGKYFVRFDDDFFGDTHTHEYDPVTGKIERAHITSTNEEAVTEGAHDDAMAGLQRTVDFAKQHGYRVLRSPAGKVMKFVNKAIDHTLVARVDNEGDSINVNFEDWNSGMSGNDDASYFDETFKKAYEKAKLDKESREQSAREQDMTEGEFTQHYTPKPEPKGILGRAGALAKKAFDRLAPGDEELLAQLQQRAGIKPKVAGPVKETAQASDLTEGIVQYFYLHDVSLIDKLAAMDGVDVDTEEGAMDDEDGHTVGNDEVSGAVVTSHNPNVTKKLMAFAQKYPARLSVKQVAMSKNQAEPVNGNWGQASSPDLTESAKTDLTRLVNLSGFKK